MVITLVIIVIILTLIYVVFILVVFLFQVFNFFSNNQYIVSCCVTVMAVFVTNLVLLLLINWI